MDQPTNLIEHLVTFVKNESLDATERELLVADKSIQTAGGSDNDVGESVLVRKRFDILLDRGTSVEDGGLHVWQILAESSVFVLDLVGQLSSVAHDQNGALPGNRLQLVKRGEDKNGGFTKTRLGLAENIDVENGGRNADLLDYGDARRHVRLDSNP